MRERHVGDVVILYPKGYLNGGDENDALSEGIKHVLGRKQKLIINFGETEHLNSEALGTLIGANARLRKEGRGSLTVCKIGHIQNIFVITKLTLVFSVYPNEEQALASFSEPRVGS